MSKKRKILTNFLILLVLLSNASYAISYSICEMTKKPACKCEMKSTTSNNNNFSVNSNSCCKTETKFISNSSDFESQQKINDKLISVVIIFNKTIQIQNPLLFSIKDKETLIFYSNAEDITLMNSSFLI